MRLSKRPGVELQPVSSVQPTMPERMSSRPRMARIIALLLPLEVRPVSEIGPVTAPAVLRVHGFPVHADRLQLGDRIDRYVVLDEVQVDGQTLQMLAVH